jgi:GTPase SAR1 family protein
MSQYDFLAKLLIVGNSGVGKTNVLLKFTANTFVMSHLTTIGILMNLLVI